MPGDPAPAAPECPSAMAAGPAVSYQSARTMERALPRRAPRPHLRRWDAVWQDDRSVETGIETRGTPVAAPSLGDAQAALQKAAAAMAEVVLDKDDVIRLSLIAVLARSHVLLEDVPGVGKTTLGRAIAQVLGGVFSRIQLTSDLLPSDLVGGVALVDGELCFRPGPVFADVVLADELNRATPRTQSGLLEAMAERSVTVDGTSHSLPERFFVIATQNPVEHQGVYPLPQSQLDRFLVRTSIGYPGEAVETQLILGGKAPSPADLPRCVPEAELSVLRGAVDAIPIAKPVGQYIQAICHATRSSPEIDAGVSTRGMLLFARACRARAVFDGRDYVSPEDVYELAVPVCAHRMTIRGGVQDRGYAEDLVRRLLEEVPGPV